MRRAASVLLLLALLAGAPGASPEDAPVWNRTRAKDAEKLAERWWAARPPTRFVEWDPKVRADLRAEAIAFGPIPEGTRREVAEALWKPVRKLGPHPGRDRSIPTPYGDATFLMNGGGRGKGLILGLHGGGAGAGSASEATKWSSKGCIGIYPQAIRLVDDAWNTVHGERFLLSLIEIAKAQYEVDPDRVYVAGFSMGGTGSWFMAGRHPDLLAGALPYHGVFMATPQSQVPTKEAVGAIQPGFLPNVRNLAMWYTAGLADRNCMPGTYLYAWDRILELREADPGGYQKIRFEAFPGVAHAFPPGEPGKGLAFIERQTRDTFPQVVVWEAMNDLFPGRTPEDREKGCERFVKRDFYWLRCEDPKDRQWIRAERKGNEIELRCTGTADGVRGITIYLNEVMIDPTKDVVVSDRDRILYRGKPQPDLWTVLETMDARVDRRMVFDRRIELR